MGAKLGAKQNPVRRRPPPCTGFAVAQGRTAERRTLLALEPSGGHPMGPASEAVVWRHPPDPQPTRTDSNRFQGANRVLQAGREPRRPSVEPPAEVAAIEAPVGTTATTPVLAPLGLHGVQ